jgi:GNAT superfamily N-acetyltransferase
MINSSIAVLAVADVTQSVDYYVNVLGFSQSWLWENPPTFGCVRCGKVEIFLEQHRKLAGHVEGHEHFFGADDVESLHERHQAAGAQIISPLENKPWGIREYTVRDINGYHLRFSGPQKYEKPLTAVDSMPPHIRIENGVPTLEQYESLFASVGWARHESMPTALQNTLIGTLAIDTRDNSVVGMTRITGDGRNFTVWDVIVRPSHQGQKIGSALIERALDELRGSGAPQGAFVGLFTGKPEFYERLGFKKDIGMHLPL